MKTDDPVVLKPGYVSWRTFITILDTLKADGVPQHLDSRVLDNLSGTVRSQLRLTFRFLGLIDENDKTQAMLENLANGDQEERKRIVKSLLKTSYGFLLIRQMVSISQKHRLQGFRKNFLASI